MSRHIMEVNTAIKQCKTIISRAEEKKKKSNTQKEDAKNLSSFSLGREKYS